MNILVTGGAGFIGSALARRLVDAGHTVVVIDNFNDYYDVQLKRDRVRTFLDGIEVIEDDVLDASRMDELFSSRQFEVVCHFAGNAGVRYSIDHPLEHIDGNVKATTLLYELMKRHGVNRMVFASTSSVYGNTTTAPFTEDVAADRPVSIYGASKRACELIGHTYHELWGIESTFLRFFTVFGPWTRPDMALLKFALKMKAGEPIEVYNHGDLRRDFTHIDDIVNGFVLAVEQPLGYEIVNLGRGEATELMTYIEALESALGIKATKELKEMQPGDVYETYADTSKARELLGFSASVPVPAGVQSFADWFLEYYA